MSKLKTLADSGAKASKENWRDNYQTPQYILDCVDKLYGGEWFDPCPANPDFDGLDMFWDYKKVYVNPPFSKHKEWCEKTLELEEE